MTAWINRRIGKANIGSVRACDTSELLRNGYVRGKSCKVPMFGGGDALLEVTQPITVWKKVKERYPFSWNYGPPQKRVIQLTLMPGALIVVHRTDSKCRANFAVVQEHDKKMNLYSGWDSKFIYRSDRCVKPRRPFSLTPDACASGIHFFFNKKAAEMYFA